MSDEPKIEPEWEAGVPFCNRECPAYGQCADRCDPCYPAIRKMHSDLEWARAAIEYVTEHISTSTAVIARTLSIADGTQEN